ncbi:unnamed protein product [Dicrocoelium dendriticum]|nr:unnamed protein product [Dicrocoelium dendriticum]
MVGILTRTPRFGIKKDMRLMKGDEAAGTEIQHKMRVPDKISYDSGISSVVYDENPIPKDTSHAVFQSPGYSPDLLNNTDVRCSASATAVSQVNTYGMTATAKAHAQSTNGLTSTTPHSLVPPSPNPNAASKRLDSQIASFQKRISSLEFRQNLMETGITLYIAYRLFRWLFRVFGQ